MKKANFEDRQKNGRRRRAACNLCNPYYRILTYKKKERKLTLNMFHIPSPILAGQAWSEKT